MINQVKNKLMPFMFIIFSLLISQYALADIEQPTGRETPVIAYFDKQSPPSQVDIWVNESGGYDSSNPDKWGLNTLVCTSSSDPVHGKCTTNPDGNASRGIASIPLQFIEKRSKLSAVINVSGYYTKVWIPNVGCENDTNPRPLYSTGIQNCVDAGNVHSDQNLFSVYLTQSELKKLPVGGVWEAQLSFNLKDWAYWHVLGKWNSTITLNMSDNANQAIYFPGFGGGQGQNAAPHVDLNLRPLPGGDRQVLGKLSGSAALDMCLYDGYGSNSRQFQVQFSEPPEYPANPDGRKSGQFSVYNDIGDRSDTGNRLDYGVKMYFPESNTFQDVVNGEVYTLPNINTDDIRAVRLATNIPNPVLCVPTPLQITTPAFDIVAKHNGHYTGKIRVIFTPSLW